MRVRGARGAIIVRDDTAEELLAATQRVLTELTQKNRVATGDIVSILFTATDDLRAAFPAEAARRMGLGKVPLLCAQEIAVPGSMPRVIRVLMHFHTNLAMDEVVHIYLDGAESLRDDLD